MDTKMKIRNIVLPLVIIIASFVAGWTAGHKLGLQRGGKRHFLLLGRIANEAYGSGDVETVEWMRAGARILERYDPEKEGYWMQMQFLRFDTNKTEGVQHQNRHVR